MRVNFITEAVDEMLDMDGDVEIGNLTFSRSEILKQCDPLAYRITVNEYIDSQIEDLTYDLNRMDEEIDADDIEDLRMRIEELEGFYI